MSQNMKRNILLGKNNAVENLDKSNEMKANGTVRKQL